MKSARGAIAALTLAMTGIVAAPGFGHAQVPPSLVTPDKVESPLGDLDF
jgi:hypothetical protein